MNDREFHLHDGKSGAAIAVRVVPRAIRTKISEILDDGTVVVRLAAPDSAGKGNQALVSFLSQVLGVNAAKLEVVAGQAGDDKLVTIIDLNKAVVQQRLFKQIAGE